MEARGELVESTSYNGHAYGLPWSSLDGGEGVVVVVDPPGVANLRARFGRRVVVFGLLGLSEEELRLRLVSRGDPSGQVEERLQLARLEAEAVRSCADEVLPAMALEELRAEVLARMAKRRTP